MHILGQAVQRTWLNLVSSRNLNTYETQIKGRSPSIPAKRDTTSSPFTQILNWSLKFTVWIKQILLLHKIRLLKGSNSSSNITIKVSWWLRSLTRNGLNAFHSGLWTSKNKKFLKISSQEIINFRTQESGLSALWCAKKHDRFNDVLQFHHQLSITFHLSQHISLNYKISFLHIFFTKYSLIRVNK